MPIDRVHLCLPFPPGSPPRSSLFTLPHHSTLSLSQAHRARYPLPRDVSLTLSVSLCLLLAARRLPFSPRFTALHPVTSSRANHVYAYPFYFSYSYTSYSIAHPSPTCPLAPNSSASSSSFCRPFHLRIDYASIHLLPPLLSNFSFSPPLVRHPISPVPLSFFFTPPPPPRSPLGSCPYLYLYTRYPQHPYTHTLYHPYSRSHTRCAPSRGFPVFSGYPAVAR